MDEGHSGTGVFYQAMPAVGADGKKIMKLVPVKIIDGKFYRMKTQQKPVAQNIPSALNPPATRNVLQKQVSPIALTIPSPLNPPSPQNVLQTKVPPIALNIPSPLTPPAPQNALQKKVPLVKPTSSQASDLLLSLINKVGLSSRPPVTVKSPVSVRTDPASGLPPGIKNKILVSSRTVSSCPAQGIIEVLYVPHINTVNQGDTPPSNHAPPQPGGMISKTLDKVSCGPKSTTPKQPSLKLIQKIPQKPNSPIKWTIEEEDGLTAPAPPVPLISPSVTSGVLRAVAQREEAGIRSTAVTRPVPQSSQGQSRHGREDALVVYNGKVFFKAQNGSEPPKAVQSDPPATAEATKKSYVFNKVPLPPKPLATQTKKDLSIIIADDVIDLCDEDVQEAATASMSAVAPPYEDNVIFVNYIPPKSGEKEQPNLSLSNSVVGQRKLSGSIGGEVKSELSKLGGRKPVQSLLVNTVRPLADVCSSSAVDKNDNEGSVIIDSQQSSSIKRWEVVVDDEGIHSLSEPCSSGIRIQRIERVMTPKAIQKPSMGTKSCQADDRLLRQTFGITDNVRICLQRIDETSGGSVLAQPWQTQKHKRSMGLHREQSEDLPYLYFYSPQGTDGDRYLIHRVTTLSQQDQSTDYTLNPHTHSGPPVRTHFQTNTTPLSPLNNGCHLGQSSHKVSCADETEPMTGYVEPIDEDFLSADEDENGMPAWPQTQIHMEANVNTRRLGRTRKRPMCPCCIPGTLATAGGKAKAARKDLKTSQSCLAAKRKSSCQTREVPACEISPTAPTDRDELERIEQIRRLRELLKEKEDALERIRNSEPR